MAHAPLGSRSPQSPHAPWPWRATCSAAPHALRGGSGAPMRRSLCAQTGPASLPSWRREDAPSTPAVPGPSPVPYPRPSTPESRPPTRAAPASKESYRAEIRAPSLQLPAPAGAHSNPPSAEPAPARRRCPLPPPPDAAASPMPRPRRHGPARPAAAPPQLRPPSGSGCEPPQPLPGAVAPTPRLTFEGRTSGPYHTKPCPVMGNPGLEGYHP